MIQLFSDRIGEKIADIEGFVIYNPANKMFSKGGMSKDIWSKSPKIWPNLGRLKQHVLYRLGGGIDYDNKKIYIPLDYKDCFALNLNGQIVDFDFVRYVVDNHGKSFYLRNNKFKVFFDEIQIEELS